MAKKISIKKIVVIGPESTGKSTLCQQLAEYFGTLWCPEYAREYLNTRGRDYTYDDLLTIAKGQLQMENEFTEKLQSTTHEMGNIAGKNQEPENKNLTALREKKIRNSKPDSINSKLLFVDTNMYVMKVWCEYVFGKCHQFIIDQIAERKYDLYLLSNIDLPWVPDDLREYPEEAPRKELYQIYKNILINQQTPWVEISGREYKQRLQQAITAVENFIF